MVAASLRGQSERHVRKLADGVYEIQHRDARNGVAGGNTTVIIGDRQVFVVDAPFLPSEAREDIAQIRHWTTRPVAFLLNTHFHNDHNLANRAYMDAFPALTIIAHTETKREMDLFGPGSEARLRNGAARYQRMLETGTSPDSTPLSDGDKAEIKKYLASQSSVLDELKGIAFQSATLTFDHDFSIDLGDREVQIKFLGRGNTPGDAVAYLPKERIVVAGDLVVLPTPYFYDGYPSEWGLALQRLAELNATAIVPGHGPVLRDNAYVVLVRDMLKSAVDQVTEALRKTGPAMSRTVNDVKGSVDLSSFKLRFAGNDKELSAAFDQAAAELVKLVFREASLR
jgi:cyclase